ncbi:MAG: hypothetical protein RL220_1764 [Bacteroidota bacterium]
MTSRPDKGFLHMLMLLILALVWGSSFILMKYGMFDQHENPVFRADHVSALRLFIAALALSPVALRAMPGLSARDWGWIALSGITGSGVPAFLFTVAQSRNDSVLAGILNSLTPFFTLVAAAVVFGRKLDLPKLPGILVGLAGAAVLILMRLEADPAAGSYLWLIVAATCSYGISVNIITQRLSEVHPLRIAAVALFITGLPSAAYFFLSGGTSVIFENDHGMKSLGFICILALGGTAMANFLYFKLAQEAGALFASSVTFLMPLVAIGWGIADNESLTWTYILAAVLMLVGVWLIRNPLNPAIFGLSKRK